MGKFYLHRGSKLIATGVCPDGQEHLQAIDGMEYGLGDPPPEIQPEIVEQAVTYADRRRMEYPPIGDQLDALWSILGPGLPPQSPAGAIYEAIQSVKRKCPKP